MLPDKAQQEQLSSIVASLNPLSTVVPCELGKVPIEIVFGNSTQGVMAKLNVEGQHRGAVAAAKALKHSEDHSSHGHDHHHHGHQHGHQHGKHSHADGGHDHVDCKARDRMHSNYSLRLLACGLVNIKHCFPSGMQA